MLAVSRSTPVWRGRSPFCGAPAFRNRTGEGQHVDVSMAATANMLAMNERAARQI